MGYMVVGRNKTGGGVGTNQYQTRGSSRVVDDISPPVLDVPTTDHIKAILALAAPTAQQRARLAKDTDAAEILHILAQDTDPEVREGVAHNSLSTSDDLAMLAHDSWVIVRAAVAGNQSTPANILTLLAADDADCIRLSVATNPSTVDKTLRRLKVDIEPTIQVYAAAALQRRTGSLYR